MNEELIEQLIREVQGKLPAAGPVDGVAGLKTWTAIHQAIVGDAPTPPPPDEVGSGDSSGVDPRSEKAILTLLPEVRPLARLLVISAAKRGIKIVVTSALRTYEEQNALYEQGRTKPGNVVTNARAGQSNHNFGLAFDITIFAGAKPVWESPLYQAIGELGKSIGLEWGGDWKKPDEPHFQLRPLWAQNLSEPQMLAELRKRKAAGRAVFA